MADVVRLRAVREGDLAVFFEQQRDPDATRMAAFPARDPEAFQAHWAKVLRDGTVMKQTILVGGRVAGNIVCFELDGERQVGYWIGREFWGRGAATRALSAFLATVAARPLHAHVAKHNQGSIRVLQKCGFAIAGERADAQGDGVDEILLVLDGR